MLQSQHRSPMSEIPDISVESKRRRVDLGMPRGFLASLSGKGDATDMLNGTDDMMESGNVAADLLRKMLHKNGHNGSVMSEKNGHDESEDAKTGDFDDDKMLSNGFKSSEIDDDKSSDETEALESGTDEGSMTEINNKTSIKENCNGSLSPTPSSTKDDLKAKRARVENIITSMRKSPTPHSHPDQMACEAPEAKRHKRKQFQPHQQRSNKSAEASGNGKTNGRRRTERRKLKELLGHLQQQLDVLSEKYFDLYEEDNSSLSDDGSDDLDDLKEPIDTLSAIHKCEQQARIQAKKRAAAENAALLGKGTPLRLRDSLKKELARTVYSTVDNVVEEFASKHIETQYSSTTPEITDTVPVLQFPNRPQQSPGSSSKSPRQTATPHRFEEEQTEALPLIVPNRSRIIKASPVLERSRTSSPQISTPSQQIVAAAAAAAVAEARAEAMTANEIMRHPFLPAFLPTSVAIPNPSLHPFSAMSLVSAHSAAEANGQKREHKDLYDEMRYSHSHSPLLSYPHPHHHPAFMHGPPVDHSNGSEMTPVGQDHMSSYSVSQMKMEAEGAASLGRGSPDLSPYSRANGASPMISTLTPTHLRKAKLMFFFSRYPSSAILRQHFPDVQFNRHNTSQIIKWFSNFREFYYIQMEKFARQAVSDGVEDAESMMITRDSELFRVLSLHYNKSNDFHVPDGFLKVSCTTLREFFEAIKLGKDAEPSWKKTIYKVIGKLDEMLPEFFKSPNCLDDLE